MQKIEIIMKKSFFYAIAVTTVLSFNSCMKGDFYYDMNYPSSYYEDQNEG